jgi:hypothetical protein
VNALKSLMGRARSRPCAPSGGVAVESPMVEWKGGGEGFDPSIRLTTDNGFRVLHRTVDLQGFSCSCASVCASDTEVMHAHSTAPGTPCSFANWSQQSITWPMKRSILWAKTARGAHTSQRLPRSLFAASALRAGGPALERRNSSRLSTRTSASRRHTGVPRGRAGGRLDEGATWSDTRPRRA